MFSPDNPYWRPGDFAGLKRGRTVTARDYLYATTWELQSWHVGGALAAAIRLMRSPIWLILWKNNFQKSLNRWSFAN